MHIHTTVVILNLYYCRALRVCVFRSFMNNKIIYLLACFSLSGVSVLSFLQCFDTVGWVIGRAVKTCATQPQRFFLRTACVRTSWAGVWLTKVRPEDGC